PSILDHNMEWILMGIATASAAAVIYFAYSMFMVNNVLPAESEEKLKPWQKVIYNKYYVDEFYDAVIRKPLDLISQFFYKFLDLQVVDGIVNGVGSAVKGLGSGIRLLQAGNIGFYVVSMVVGVILILLFTFIL
ncbi:MAG: NADH-quinone oxidoreductase subunit L, partial [Bacteroidia bacterium]